MDTIIVVLLSMLAAILVGSKRARHVVRDSALGQDKMKIKA